MIDLATLIDQFEPSTGPRRDEDLGKFPTAEMHQDTEGIDISHISQFPTAKQERYRGYSCDLKTAASEISDERTARDVRACGVGNLGTAGNVNENNDLSFPFIDRELGNWEKEDVDPAGALTSTLSDEVDAPVPLAGVPSPVPPATVRAAVEREIRALSDLGVTGPEADRRAVEITAAKIRNAPVLAERQAHPGRCHHCGEGLDELRPVVAVLCPGAGHLFMHSGCCVAYGTRRIAIVDSIMAGAGYGAVVGERSGCTSL